MQLPIPIFFSDKILSLITYPVILATIIRAAMKRKKRTVVENWMVKKELSVPSLKKIKMATPNPINRGNMILPDEPNE